MKTVIKCKLLLVLQGAKISRCSKGYPEQISPKLILTLGDKQD